MKKMCPKCKKKKSPREFNSQGKYCRLCHNENNREWRESYPEKMTETRLKYDYKKFGNLNDDDLLRCSGCNEEKKAIEFGWKNRKKRIRHNRCRKCQSISSKKHYVNHKEECIERARNHSILYRRRVTREVLLYLRSHPCVDCGESRPLRLEFDHVSGKKDFAISDGIRKGMAWEKILIEISKCDVRCSNCHSEKTAKEGNFLMARLIEEGL